MGLQVAVYVAACTRQWQLLTKPLVTLRGIIFIVFEPTSFSRCNLPVPHVRYHMLVRIILGIFCQCNITRFGCTAIA